MGEACSHDPAVPRFPAAGQRGRPRRRRRGGAAFGAVVASLVADLITPLIAAIFGKPDFGALKFTINGSVFRYGSFLNAMLSLVTVSAAIFFLVVKPVGALMERRKAGLEPEAEAVPEDVILLGEIRDLLRARP
jgi:large conductance mechanosensitive channel